MREGSAGSRDRNSRSGNKTGFSLKGLTIFGKTRQPLGIEQNPTYYVLKFHPLGS